MTSHRDVFEDAYENRQTAIRDIEDVIIPRIERLLLSVRESDLPRRKMLEEQRIDAMKRLQQLKNYRCTDAELRYRRRTSSLYKRTRTDPGIPDISILSYQARRST